MRNYTVLGQGRSSKVLAVADHVPARTVTTCPAEAATEVARALVRTDREIPTALYALAVSLDGRPVEARRHLLGFYDEVTGGADRRVRSDGWQAAETLVARVADAVAGQPAPVVAAVRAELGEHLIGLDGVLVPGRATSGGYRRAHLDLAVSGPLTWLGDSWWDYLTGPHGDLGVTSDDGLFPSGGPRVSSMELYALPHELFHVEPTGQDWADGLDMQDLFEQAGEDSVVEIGIRVDHFVAWVAHHRPAQLAAVRAALQG